MRKFVGAAVAAGVLAAATMGTALAAKPPWAGGGTKPAHTKMRFKLEDHSVDPGETVSGSVLVLTGKGKDRTALEGATLTVSVDKVEVGTVVTDAEGKATVEYLTSDDGEHVMKVAYAGDDAHKRAKRAQGFEVGVVEDEEDLGEVTEEDL